MRPAREWLEGLADLPADPAIEGFESRTGDPSLKVGGIAIHSRYNPRDEAKRLVDSSSLDADRPVLVIGLGLGYHVLELEGRGFEVAVVEESPAVAKLALEGPFAGSTALLGVGKAEEIVASPAFEAFVARSPQVFAHPPSSHARPDFAQAIESRLARAELSESRISIAVVGPMYGGSLPIAAYLERAFSRAGHRTVLVDHSGAHALFEQMTKTGPRRGSGPQLAGKFVEVLSDWSLEQVMEFGADLCFVLAQAPVTVEFPKRLAAEGVVSAFWFVENWRHLSYWEDIAAQYDYFFHLQAGEFEERLEKAGCKHHAVVQTGCDPEIHSPQTLSPEEREGLGCDLSFAGAGYRNRKHFFTGLTDFDFKIWGVDWNVQELAPLLCRRDERFTPELFAKIVSASKINLNLHSSAIHSGVDPDSDTINPRVFEIAACGGFQLCDPCKGLETLFDFETEVPVYRDLGEARELIAHYLAHPKEREAVAKRARDRALGDHSYDRRARQMLDLILKHHGGRMIRRGVRAQRTVSEVGKAVGRDTALGEYLAGLPEDLLFTYDTVLDQLPEGKTDLSYPEQVFAFLRELRQTNEGLAERK